MSPTNGKIFEDPVHGHFTIPHNYCKTLIDTELFQRLRRVEQTAMCTIFPTAHHDRFSHSLGTFHVGRRLFEHLKNNTEKFAPKHYKTIKSLGARNNFFAGKKRLLDWALFRKSSDQWFVLQNTYEIACLLHDCCHAPFSHTFEDYYTRAATQPLDTPLYQALISEYRECVSETSAKPETIEKVVEIFKTDLANASPKPHEVASAWLLLNADGFRQGVKDAGANPLLAARMIMGCSYRANNEDATLTDEEQILNCFISLLNGHEIDADRLDYATRDQWAAGLHTPKINLDRLFSAIFITKHEGKFVVCFKKQGVPELSVLLDVKNYISFWIFSHHKIQYQVKLLVKAVERLAILLAGDETIRRYQKLKNLTNRCLENNGRLSRLQTECNRMENEAMYNMFACENLIDRRVHSFTFNGVENCWESLYLMSDDTIVYLLRKYFCMEYTIADELIEAFVAESRYANEWFSRAQELMPLWKTYSEYHTLYLRRFSLEREALTLLKKLVDREFVGREMTPSIATLRLHLKNDVGFRQVLSKIANPRACVHDIIDRYQVNLEQDPLNAERLLFEDINKALNHFSDTDKIKNAIRDKAKETLQHFQDEGSITAQRGLKEIPVDKLFMKEIDYDGLYVQMESEPYRYKDLNIPSHSSDNKDYSFVYLYIPTAAEFDKKLYFEKFQSLLGCYGQSLWS